MLKNHSIQYSIQFFYKLFIQRNYSFIFFKNYSFKEIIFEKLFIQRKIHSKKLTIIYSKNYSFRKKWELFIQKIIQLEKNYSITYSFKKFENYSFKKIIHFFEKLIIAQGYFLVTWRIYNFSMSLGLGVYPFNSLSLFIPSSPSRMPR